MKHLSSKKYYPYMLFISIVVLIYFSFPCFADTASAETEFFEWVDSIPKFHSERVFIEEEAFVTWDKAIWFQDFGRLRAMTGHFLASVNKMGAICKKDRARYRKIYPQYFEVLSEYQSALEEMASDFHRTSSELGKESKELNYSFEDYAHDLNSYSNLRDDYREIRKLINTFPIFTCPWIWDTSRFDWIDHFQNVASEWASLESEWIATERRTSFIWDNVIGVGLQDFKRLQDVTAYLMILLKGMRLIDENDMRRCDKLHTNYFVVSSQYLNSLEQVISELYRIVSELDKKSRDVTYYPWEQHIEDMTSYNKLKDSHRQIGKLMQIIYQEYSSERKFKLKKELSGPK